MASGRPLGSVWERFLLGCRKPSAGPALSDHSRRPKEPASQIPWIRQPMASVPPFRWLRMPVPEPAQRPAERVRPSAPATDPRPLARDWGEGESQPSQPVSPRIAQPEEPPLPRALSRPQPGPWQPPAELPQPAPAPRRHPHSPGRSTRLHLASIGFPSQPFD